MLTHGCFCLVTIARFIARQSMSDIEQPIHVPIHHCEQLSQRNFNEQIDITPFLSCTQYHLHVAPAGIVADLASLVWSLLCLFDPSCRTLLAVGNPG